MDRNKILVSLMGGALAVGMFGTAAVTFAQSATPSAATPSATTPAQAVPLEGQRSFMRGPEGNSEALAAALGITVEELQAAQVTARDAMIDQAVTDGYLTQAQADQLKANTFGMGRMGHIGIYDNDEYLADALGITPDALQAAQLEAHATELAAAVEAGYLTQEQADIMLARRAAQTYLDRDALQAQMQAAYETALNAAVADGAITQAQADALLAQMASQPFDFGGFGGHGGGRGGHGHGGPRGFGGFDSTVPAPSTAPDTNTNTNTSSTGQDI